MRVSSTTVIVLAMAASAAAFTSPLSVASSRPSALSMSLEPQQPEDESSANDLFQTATAAVLPVVLAASPANAAGPDWGIFEGKTGSLLHPIMMGSLLIYAISTGLLGFQWRRQRTLGDDMKALQNQLPSGIKTASDVQSAMQEEGANVAQLQAALPVAQELEALQAERKELASKGPRDQHFGQGAMLAFLGTAFAIEVSCRFGSLNSCLPIRNSFSPLPCYFPFLPTTLALVLLLFWNDRDR